MFPLAGIFAFAYSGGLGVGALQPGELRLGRLLTLHRDEAGNIQSLSFVLTLPVFIFVMLMIVQVSQLMIGIVVVNYAAFAAARSAAVRIPAAMPAPKVRAASVPTRLIPMLPIRLLRLPIPPHPAMVPAAAA